MILNDEISLILAADYIKSHAAEGYSLISLGIYSVVFFYQFNFACFEFIAQDAVAQVEVELAVI